MHGSVRPLAALALLMTAPLVPALAPEVQDPALALIPPLPLPPLPDGPELPAPPATTACGEALDAAAADFAAQVEAAADPLALAADPAGGAARALAAAGAAPDLAPATVWTSENMGPGSCLDADTLDGFSSGDVQGWVAAEATVRRTADATLQTQIAAEAQERFKVDMILAGFMGFERTERIRADDALSARAANLEGRASALEGHVNKGNFRGGSLQVSGDVIANDDVMAFGDVIVQDGVRLLGGNSGLVCDPSTRGTLRLRLGGMATRDSALSWTASWDTLEVCMRRSGGFPWEASPLYGWVPIVRGWE